MRQRLLECLRQAVARLQARRRRRDLALELGALRRHMRGHAVADEPEPASRLAVLAVSGVSLASALWLVAQPPLA